MNKAELVEHVAKSAELTKADAQNDQNQSF